MRVRLCVLAALASLALAGCSSAPGNGPGKSGLWSWGEDTPPPAGETTGSISKSAMAETTGSIGSPAEGAPNPRVVKDAMLGSDANDDLSLGKRHYRERQYGLA